MPRIHISIRHMIKHPTCISHTFTIPIHFNHLVMHLEITPKSRLQKVIMNFLSILNGFRLTTQIKQNLKAISISFNTFFHQFKRLFHLSLLTKTCQINNRRRRRSLFLNIRGLELVIRVLKLIKVTILWVPLILVNPSIGTIGWLKIRILTNGLPEIRVLRGWWWSEIRGFEGSNPVEEIDQGHFEYCDD
ncbi:hypothetical protein MtrunA17_Chr4g0044981 [Medicago truncatula]|uniref:Uncharacterized protein n=1 Tax=Medicago truncatula TaxID=3880 RepID=A0A396I9D5_MEDTR|nr:hypothetical protein MtrunA17_Chr4g0044981 [Medicago truncatula]